MEEDHGQYDWLTSAADVLECCALHMGFSRVLVGIQDLSFYISEESEHRLQVVVGAVPFLFMSMAICSSISCDMLSYCIG